MRVVKLREIVVVLAPANDAGNLKARDAARDSGFKYMNDSLGPLPGRRAPAADVCLGLIAALVTRRSTCPDLR